MRALQKRFYKLASNYSNNNATIAALWMELEELYGSKRRFYHTLEHLEYIYEVLSGFELSDALEFAIFYHDSIYFSKNNEEQSAVLAQKRLSLLGVPRSLIKDVVTMILDTKTHIASKEQNILFLDADIAILGASSQEYNQYAKNIQKEYSYLSPSVYKRGRKQVLENFLKQKRLFKSDYFFFYKRGASKSKYRT